MFVNCRIDYWHNIKYKLVIFYLVISCYLWINKNGLKDCIHIVKKDEENLHSFIWKTDWIRRYDNERNLIPELWTYENKRILTMHKTYISSQRKPTGLHNHTVKWWFCRQIRDNDNEERKERERERERCYTNIRRNFIANLFIIMNHEFRYLLRCWRSKVSSLDVGSTPKVRKSVSMHVTYLINVIKWNQYIIYGSVATEYMTFLG